MNNFNMSSAGENIELNVSYDSDLMQFWFDDFKDGSDGNPVKLYGKRETDYCIIGDLTEKHYKKSELKKMKKAELINIMNQYDDSYYYNNEASKIELIQELLNITHEQYYDYVYKNNLWYDLPCDFTSRGYSQGDSVKVLILDNVEYKPTQKDIDNIFWNCPISINLEVGDNEFNEDDLLEDIYEYDKDSVAKKVSGLDISDYAKEWITANLPSEPKYN